MLFLAISLWCIGVVSFHKGAKFGFVFSDHGKQVFALCWIIGSILAAISAISLFHWDKKWLIAIGLLLSSCGIIVRIALLKIHRKNQLPKEDGN